MSQRWLGYLLILQQDHKGLQIGYQLRAPAYLAAARQSVSGNRAKKKTKREKYKDHNGGVHQGNPSTKQSAAH